MVQTVSVPPVEKLPLAARKDIRDEFDTKIEELTKTVSDLLKKPYKLEVNFNQFYAYAAASSDADWVKRCPGAAATQYFTSFVYYLKKFTDDGEYTDAIETFNDLVSESRVSIEAGNSTVTYSACSVEAGTFEINFNPTRPGVNVDYACSEMEKSFDEALFARSPERLPMIAKRGIRDDYENKKEDLLRKFKEALLGADVKLVADYDAIWNQIVAGKKVNKDINPQDSARSLGSYIYSYFEGAASQFESKLEKDDMMVEGYTEAVSTGEIVIDVVPEGTTLKSSYGVIEIADGKLFIKVTPKNFGTNAYYIAQDIVSLL